MNIDLLFPTLTGDLAQLAQANPADPGQDGQEFEEMLVQQSKAQREDGEPQKKAEEKKAPEEPEQKSTQEDEAAEEGGNLAAALVTSQPVVPIVAFDTAEVKVAEDGTVILEPAMTEGVVQEQQPTQEQQPAEIMEMAEAQPEAAPQQEQPQEAEVRQAAGMVREAPKQEQPKTDGQTIQEEAKVQDTDKPRIAVQKPQENARSQDEEMDANVEQESQPVFQNVKAAPVKVGEANPQYLVEEPQDPENSHQLAGTLNQALQDGSDMVLIQLNPANLGRVAIELSRNAAGELTIVMNPQTTRAADILNAHTDNLIASLMERGENVASVQVNMPEDTQNAGMMVNPDGHNGQTPSDEDDGKKKKRQEHTGGVSALDFLSQLRLGLVGTEGIE